jgi:transposase
MRKPYPSDVSDEEWAFVAPYLSLMIEDAPQREHSLREVFNGLRWMVRTGASWRMMPHDLPPWAAIYQQTQRWIKSGVFEAIVDDLRQLLLSVEWAQQTTECCNSQAAAPCNPPLRVVDEQDMTEANETRVVRCILL